MFDSRYLPQYEPRRYELSSFVTLATLWVPDFPDVIPELIVYYVPF